MSPVERAVALGWYRDPDRWWVTPYSDDRTYPVGRWSWCWRCDRVHPASLTPATHDAVLDVQRAIRELMGEGRNPTVGWLLARVRGVYTAARLRHILRAGIRAGMLAGPGRGGRSGYRIAGGGRQ